MNPRSAIALVVLVPFFGFSLWVADRAGPLGFLTLVAREPWGAQISLDLAIALTVASTVVVRDARARGLRAWPWLVSMTALGSIGLLGYFVYREVAPKREA